MTDFVLSVVNADRPCDRGKILDEIGLYAEFLKQPLKLEMFVPCDDSEQAKEKVLFEGFDEDSANMLMYYNDSIEHIVYNNIELTPNAIKQFGL